MHCSPDVANGAGQRPCTLGGVCNSRLQSTLQTQKGRHVFGLNRKSSRRTAVRAQPALDDIQQHDVVDRLARVGCGALVRCLRQQPDTARGVIFVSRYRSQPSDLLEKHPEQQHAEVLKSRWLAVYSK